MDVKQKICAIGCTATLAGLGIYISVESIRSSNGDPLYAEMLWNTTQPYIENVADFLKGN